MPFEQTLNYLQKLQTRMIFYCQLKLKNAKAEFCEFLQQEFSPPKYFWNLNLNLFPMTKHYQEFQTFLQTQISNLEQNNQLKLTIEQREKIAESVKILWLYDLRKITTSSKYYPQIIKNYQKYFQFHYCQ